MRAAIFLFAAGFLLFLRVHADARPDVRDDVPLTEFSAKRAFVHLEKIAAEPRPIGSPAAHRTRDLILRLLSEAGVSAHVERELSVRTLIPRVHAAGNVENVVAVIPGATPEMFLFLSHYDSVPTGPGAGDNGASVAAALETIRAIRMRGVPHRTLVFLFSDGEEAGLLGAQAFARRAPSIAGVFDFEARGISGDSILFQTGPASGGLLAAFLKNAKYAAGSSLGPALYDVLPNDTDFSVFKRRGYAGLDFAFIGDVQAYHTTLDNPANLDLKSLQHHGENMLTLAMLGDVAPAGPSVYFSIWPGLLIRYPVWLAQLLTGLTWMACVLFLRRDFLNSLRAAAILLGAVLISGALSYLVWLMLRRITGAADSVLGQPHNYRQWQMLFVFLGLLAAFVATALARRHFSERARTGGALLLFLIPLAFSLWFPGASYALVWPCLIAPGSHFARRLPLGRSGRMVVSFLCAAAVGLYAWDVVTGIFLSLTVRTGFVAASLVSLYAFLAVSFLDDLMESEAWTAGSTLASGSLISAVLVCTTGNGPRLNSLAYGFEAETGKAFYFSCATEQDSFTSNFFQNAVRTGVLPALPVMKQCLSGEMFQLATATVRESRAPIATASITRQGSLRKVSIRVLSPREATGLIVSLRNSSSLRALKLGSFTLPLDLKFAEGKLGLQFLKGMLRLDEWHTIVFAGLDRRGLELEVDAEGNDPVELRVTDRSRNLPEGRRDPGMIQAPEFPFSDGVYITRTFRF